MNVDVMREFLLSLLNVDSHGEENEMRTLIAILGAAVMALLLSTAMAAEELSIVSHSKENVDKVRELLEIAKPK